MKKIFVFISLLFCLASQAQNGVLYKEIKSYTDSTSFVTAIVRSGISSVIYAGVNSNLNGTFVSHDTTGLTLNGTSIFPTGVGNLRWLKTGNLSTGSGTVTSFSAGTLSPLFTTSVATATSTPALTFAQSNTTQFSVLGRIASGSGAYSFVTADSTLIQGLHSEAYYNTKYGTGGGTVTSVTSADGNATVATSTTTPVITIVSAPKWLTGRTLSITGDLTYTSPSFDGSGNVTAAGTLSTVNSNVGSFTNVNITVNAKGLITAASNGSGGGGGTGLTPTAIKTTSYTASVGDYVPCNTTSAAFTVTLPLAPSNSSVIAVQVVTYGAGNNLTIQASGSDVFNKSGGATTLTLTYVNQIVWLQYNSGIWYYLTNTPIGSIVGTTNQVNISTSGSTVTASLPQSIATSSNVTFNNLTLGGGLGTLGLDGSNTSMTLKTSGTLEGYVFTPGSNGVYFSDAVVGDIGLRSESHSTILGSGSGHSAFQVNSSNVSNFSTSVQFPYTSKITTYTATATDHTIDCTGGGTFTVTLPTAASITGRVYVITNSGAGTITIATTSSQTFTNVATAPTTLSIVAQGFYAVQSTGSAWIVTAKN